MSQPLLHSLHSICLRGETTRCRSKAAWVNVFFCSGFESLGPDMCWGPCLSSPGLYSFSDFSHSHRHLGEALQSSIYLQMQDVQWQMLKGLCFAFLMPLTGHPRTGTSLKPCFNISVLANRPPVGLRGSTVHVCASLTLYVRRNCVCTFTFCQQGLHSPVPPWWSWDSCGCSE